MNKNFNIKIVFFIILFFSLFFHFAQADDLEASFLIRNGDAVLWNDVIALPTEGVINLDDKDGVSHEVNSRSVLGVLSIIDEASDAFSISTLEFYDSFGSFYIKCISDESSVESCDYWQYVVDDTSPWESIDATLLSGGENVGIYFGTLNRLVLGKEEISIVESVEVTAQRYNYVDNTWNVLSGVSVGVTLPNPDDPWSPIVVETFSVDSDGKAIINIPDPDTYTVGIVEDFYFPAYTLNVIVPPLPPPPPVIVESFSNGSIGSIGSGTPAPTRIVVVKEEEKVSFDIINATLFLKINEREYNIGTSDIYTDWAIIAYSASGLVDEMKDSIYARLENYKIPSTLLTDNERRAMVLLSLGENPYSFRDINYIEIIINSFDGVQFGDTALVNDDIFALIPLASAGYNASDEIIIKDIAFILSKQREDGSWEGSADLTAASIQALYSFNTLDGVEESIARASIYLESMQEGDGGWGSVYATSWVMQTMNTLNNFLMKDNKTAMDYMISKQNADGGMLKDSEILQNRLWATSYTIPAIFGKSWSSLFFSVEKIMKEEEVITPKVVKNVVNVSKVEKTVEEKIEKEQNVIAEVLINSLSASAVQADVLIPNKSIFKKVLSFPSNVFNFIQSGIHRLFVSF